MASANKAEKLEMGFVIRAKGNNQIKKKIGVLIPFNISNFLQRAKTFKLVFLFFSFLFLFLFLIF
jgi:hypothetical protein